LRYPKPSNYPSPGCCREIALSNAREVAMRASGSTTVFGRLPWPQAPELAQFHPDPGLDARRDVQGPDTDKPSFEKRTEPVGAAPTEILFGPFRLLPTQFLLLEGDKAVRLGSRALEILIVLLERPAELVSKQELMARVWPNIFVEPANLTVHISALRRTLRDGRDGNRFIINVPGRGYSFVAALEVSDTRTERERPSQPRSFPGSSRPPYGATTIAGGDVARRPTANELPGSAARAASSIGKTVACTDTYPALKMA
jgi:DNA-binding winged helix-turn-helix (wHTH) protein